MALTSTFPMLSPFGAKTVTCAFVTRCTGKRAVGTGWRCRLHRAEQLLPASSSSANELRDAFVERVEHEDLDRQGRRRRLELPSGATPRNDGSESNLSALFAPREAQRSGSGRVRIRIRARVRREGGVLRARWLFADRDSALHARERLPPVRLRAPELTFEPPSLLPTQPISNECKCNACPMTSETTGRRSSRRALLGQVSSRRPTSPALTGDLHFAHFCTSTTPRSDSVFWPRAARTARPRSSPSTDRACRCSPRKSSRGRSSRRSSDLEDRGLLAHAVGLVLRLLVLGGRGRSAPCPSSSSSSSRSSISCIPARRRRGLRASGTARRRRSSRFRACRRRRRARISSRLVRAEQLAGRSRSEVRAASMVARAASRAASGQALPRGAA